MKTGLLGLLIRSTFFLQFIFMSLTEDFVFYWSHRLLHTPFLYKHVHKVHHEFPETVAYAAAYFHWLEYILAILTPLYINRYILGHHLHLSTFIVYVFVSAYRGVYGHCGYEFPYFPFNIEVFGSNINSRWKES